MALVEAKCTNCGAKLEVDNAKEAAVCPACNSPFIVEKAINNITNNITNENNFTNSNVTIVNNGSISLDDGVYDGETKSGKPHGYGVCQYSDGSKYEGNWLAGAKNGEGTIVYEDGSSWTGIWKNNEPWTGTGRVFAYRHCYYEGEYKNGEANGNGALYYDNGKKWTGFFKNGNEWDGEGYIEFYNSFGSLYQTYEGKVADGEADEFGEWYCDGHFEEDGTVFDVTKGVLNYINTLSETITIPDGIQSVNSNLGGFYDVKEIICPKTLTKFYVEESYKLEKLEKFVAPGIVNVSDKMLYGLQNLKEVKLDNAKEIGKEAFRGCCNLTAIYIPNVIKIAKNAFRGCKKLPTINLPKVETIGEDAFCKCEYLATIDLPKVETIGGEAFCECGNLATIYFPCVTEVARKTFSGCVKLADVDLPKVKTVGEKAFYNCDLSKNLNIPKVEIIESSALEHTNLKKLHAPNLVRIGKEAFSKNESLSEVYLPQIETIDMEAFLFCIELKCFESNSLKHINKTAFYGCSELKSFVCPNAELFGEYINHFDHCPKLENLVLSQNVDKSKIKKYLKKKSGCYVATCVYGSYDCPQVWTLRRYRDNTLASTWYGRAFIRTYYAISPTIVKWFGNTQWFKNLWKNKLDKMVFNLRSNGVEDTPYQDKDWR